MSDDIFFVYSCKIISQVCSSFSRASNSPIKVKYKGYSAAYYNSTPNGTIGGGGGATLSENYDTLLSLLHIKKPRPYSFAFKVFIIVISG